MCNGSKPFIKFFFMLYVPTQDLPGMYSVTSAQLNFLFAASGFATFILEAALSRFLYSFIMPL